MQTLRTELIETQKVRSDLMKWKLIIIAIVGGAALGLSSGGGAMSQSPLALAILPIACVYVDLLCRHLSLRTKAIGLFFANSEHDNKVLRDYERFYIDLSRDAWKHLSLESMALLWCTLTVSILTVPIGILAADLWRTPASHLWELALLIGSGTSGVVLSLISHWRYEQAKKAAEDYRPSKPTTIMA